MSDKDKSKKESKPSTDDWAPVRSETIEKRFNGEEGDNNEA